MQRRPAITITEFLTSRFDEDAADWLAEYARETGMLLHGRLLAPRMLAEIAAKRAIVTLAVADIAAADAKSPDDLRRMFDGGAAFAMHNALMLLTGPYAEHPDFDPGWRL